MRNENVKKIAIAALAVVINIVLGYTVSALHIPLLFLDTVGTIYISAKYGLKYGVLVAICTHLVLGVISGAPAIAFVLVSIAVAVVVSIMAKNTFSIKKSILTGLILSIVCPLIGTPIRLLLFGGFTGSGTDLLILALKASGKTIFASTFISTIAGNFVDKILSCLLVAFLLKQLAGITKEAPQH